MRAKQNYKSWAGLKKQMEGYLCKELQGRITYFLTRYHQVHNAYGRASILLDKKEMIHFGWLAVYKQDEDINKKELEEEVSYGDRKAYEKIYEVLKPKWDEACTYAEGDFLEAALRFRNLSIQEALASDNYIIRIFAILDRRMGKRTLEKIKKEECYKDLPDWVKIFYELRLSLEEKSIEDIQK